MTSASTFRTRSLAVLGGTAIAPFTLAGCSTGGSTPTASASITAGTIHKVTWLDPAGSYDNGAFAVMNQIYPFPLSSKPGSSDVQPDIAESAKFNQLAQFKEFPDYKGMLGAPRPRGRSHFLHRPVHHEARRAEGGIDVASRSLSAIDIADLKKDSAVKVMTGPGGEIRCIVFNFDTQPFGVKAEGANAAKARAVRRAVAALFISHDLAVVDILADRIAVLYRGELVEEGTGAEVLGAAKHPYTKRLLASLPVQKPAKQALRREELRMLRARD